MREFAENRIARPRRLLRYQTERPEFRIADMMADFEVLDGDLLD